MSALKVRPVDGDFDLGHLQAIHAALVEGFYAWGGQLRDTDTGPGGTGIAHCRPEFIRPETDRVFGSLAGQGYLKNLSRDEFSQALAWVWGETTAIHPFRDVNTRSQFIFFNQLAEQAGWIIDWSRIDPYVFAHARTRAITVSEDGIDALLYPALRRLEDNDAQDAQAGDRGSTHFVNVDPDSLNQALHEALERRRG